MRAVDAPGTLAAIMQAMADHGISINSVRQASYVSDGVDPLVTIVTHPAAVLHLDRAVDALCGMEQVREVVSVLRVEGE